MKRITTVLIIILATTATLYLSSCFSPPPPSTLTVDGLNYLTGFYGDLWPNDLSFKEDSTQNNRIKHVIHEQFDWIYCLDTDKIYCLESQWEEARFFYANDTNFIYFCLTGGKYVEDGAHLDTLYQIDTQKFDSLMIFADMNDYNPFGSNKHVQTRRLNIPDKNESPELIFYKVSNDGYFTSYKGYTFYIINNKLLFLFYYDFGHGAYEQMLVVDVPNDLGDYFVDLIEQLDD